MLKALDWGQKTFPLSARGKAVDQGKAVPGEKYFCRPPTVRPQWFLGCPVAIKALQSRFLCRDNF